MSALGQLRFEPNDEQDDVVAFTRQHPVEQIVANLFQRSGSQLGEHLGEAMLATF